jgi:hypothetical protein
MIKPSKISIIYLQVWKNWMFILSNLSSWLCRICWAELSVAEGSPKGTSQTRQNIDEEGRDAGTDVLQLVNPSSCQLNIMNGLNISTEIS